MPHGVAVMAVAVTVALHFAAVSSDGGGAEHGPVGWVDCSGSAPDARSIQRAWRRLSLDYHPDKAGRPGHRGQTDPSKFADMTELRDALKEPDRYQLFKLLQNLHRPADIRPYGETFPDQRVTSASLLVKQKCDDLLDKSTCFPYAALSLDFALSKPPLPGSTWTFSMAACAPPPARRLGISCCPMQPGLTSIACRCPIVDNVSTIQYKGDEKTGGYDACCDFMASSNCTRRPPPLPTAEGMPAICGPGEGEGSCGQSSGRSAAWQAELGPADRLEWDYLSHDCPLPEVFSGAVTRPLHRMEAGRWAATLSLRGPGREELACLAAAFDVHPGELNAKAGGGGGGGGAGQVGQDGQDGGPAGNGEAPEEAPGGAAGRASGEAAGGGASDGGGEKPIGPGAGPHNMDYLPTKWPCSPRIVAQRDPRASNAPDHLGLSAPSVVRVRAPWAVLLGRGRHSGGRAGRLHRLHRPWPVLPHRQVQSEVPEAAEVQVLHDLCEWLV